MISVKGAGGGGKKEGLYVWKKYATTMGSLVETPNKTHNVIIFPISSFTYYESTSYTINEDGTFTLDNPTERFATYESKYLNVGKYYTFNSPTADTMYYTSAYSTTTYWTYNSDTQQMQLYDSGSTKNLVICTYDAETVVIGDFLDYVVSDDENAYPDGEVLDGYWYERARATKYGMFWTKTNADGHATSMEIYAPDNACFTSNGTGYNANTQFMYCENVDIYQEKIPEQAYYGEMTVFGGKLKLKNVKSIGILAFRRLFSIYSRTPYTKRAVWISINCTEIAPGLGVATQSPFYEASSGINIYCEVESRPSGWSNLWNYYSGSAAATTTWGVTEEQFDAL